MLVPTMAFLWWRFQYNVRTVHGSPYTFSVKPKWRKAVFWFFAARSSAEAYFRTSPPRGHSTVGVPKRCEGFVAICLRACEDIADNRFQLLFINIARFTYVWVVDVFYVCIYTYIRTLNTWHTVNLQYQRTRIPLQPIIICNMFQCTYVQYVHCVMCWTDAVVCAVCGCIVYI